IPLFPVFCLWAARLVTAPTLKREAARAWAAAAAVIVGLTAWTSVSCDRIMTSRDPRDQVADWLERAAPQGAPVAFATVPWFYSPPLSPYFGALAAPVRAKAADHTTRYQLRIPQQEWSPNVLNPLPDYIVLSNIESMHAVDRLRLPGPTRFVYDIPP